MTMQNSQTISNSDPVAQCIWNYKEEAFEARRNRVVLNQQNFECYNLRQDYSHKRRGQSREFLSKQQMAVEQITSYLQQGLMDQGDWFRIEAESGVDVDKLLIKPEEQQKLLLRQLNKNNFTNYLSDTLKLGLLGSLMITKVGGNWVTKCEYATKFSGGFLGLGGKKTLTRKERRVWQLLLSCIRQEDYFPDPTGRGLYEVQRIEMDYHELLQIAQDNPDDFDYEACKRVAESTDDLQRMKKARETNQNIAWNSYRKPVTIFECWGTLLKPGTGEVLKSNCVSAISMTGEVIRPPKDNPLWHGQSPFIAEPIIRVPHSVWHKAVMDAPTMHNHALNELYNLMLDAGMMAVFGIKQIRSQWLENPQQVADGVPPGETLLVNNSCPPGAKVLERVDTGALSQEALMMFNTVDREFQQSSLTNDTRMGTLPQRQVKATEIVASNQTITGIFNGIVKTIETEKVAKVLDLAWLTMAQHMNDLDDDEVKALIGDDRANQLAGMDNADLFASTATGKKYKVFGLSQTMNKIQDFRKITSLLQTIGNNPEMMQEFNKKYSMTKLLGEIIKSLDIDEDKIKASQQEIQQKEMERQQMMQLQMQAAQNKANGAKGGGQHVGPHANSQIKQMASTQPEGNPIKEAQATMGQATS